MRIHLLSDLHLEFEPFEPPAMDADVVVLAGDIHIKGRGVDWAVEAFSCPVLYIPGNHEYHTGHLFATLKKMRSLGSNSHVQVLDRDVVIIGGVRFLGATMWTDFGSTGHTLASTINARNSMNDYSQIRTGQNFRRLKPEDQAKESVTTRLWLEGQLAKPFQGQTVVITHHAPLLRSLADSPYSGTHLDAAYANEWPELLGGERVALWAHGHCHTAVDYQHLGTRIACNPRGYPGENTGFNPGLIIDL